MPSFFLDDQEIPFEKGQDVLTAVKNAGGEIPHFCYHEGLSRAATCRMCLVDVLDAGNGRALPKLQTSCSTPASENMKISSTNERVILARKQVMEFLLINHPLDCPICDQSGECMLQDFSFEHGTGQSQILHEKRLYGWRDIGTFLQLERNRCVHCTRCVRFSQEITQTSEMGVFGRNHELTVDTFIDNPLSDLFQGNMADICPVGAITTKDFRFHKRVWKLKKTPSVCGGCSTGCNIYVSHHKNQVYRFTPRENQAVNRWWMCDPGRISFHDQVDATKRQKTNLISGKAVSLEEATRAASEQLKNIDPKKSSCILIGSSHCMLEELFAFKQFATTTFKEVRFICPPAPKEKEENPLFIYNLITNDKSPNSKGLEFLDFVPVTTEEMESQEKWESTDCVILLGSFSGDDFLKKVTQKSKVFLHITEEPSKFSKQADVVFALSSSLEKTGTLINKNYRLQKNKTVLPSKTQHSDGCELTAKITQTLYPQKNFQETSAEVFENMAKSFPALKGRTLKEIPPQGIDLKEPIKVEEDVSNAG